MDGLTIRQLKDTKIVIDFGRFIRKVDAQLATREDYDLPLGVFYDGRGGSTTEIPVHGHELVIEAYRLYGVSPTGQAFIQCNDDVASCLYVGIPLEHALVLNYTTGVWRFEHEFKCVLGWKQIVDGYQPALTPEIWRLAA